MPLFPRLRARIAARRAQQPAGAPPIEPYEHELAPPPRPLRDALTGLALRVALNRLKGNLPMLTGYKTYITAGLMVALAVAGLAGISVGDYHPDPASLIMAAIGLVFARNGAKTEVKKLVE